MGPLGGSAKNLEQYGHLVPFLGVDGVAIAAKRLA